MSELEKYNVEHEDDEKREEPKYVDPDVQMAVDLIHNSHDSIIRMNRMDNNMENKDILDAIHSTLPSQDSPRRIKDTKMMQILRLISEDVHREPAVFAQPMAGENELVAQTVDATVKRLKKIGRYSDAYRKVITNAVQREGTSYMVVTPAEKIDYSSNGEKKEKILNYSYIDAANVFGDPSVNNISEGDWVAFRYEYSNAEAEQVLEDVYGYVDEFEYGDPLVVFNAEESGENDEDLIPDRTTIYDMWHKVKKKRIVFVGRDKALVKKVSGRKEYPYKDEYGQCALPIGQLDATPFKNGMYAASWVDVAKDVTEQYKRQFNNILPYFERVTNQLLAVTGVTPLEDIAGQIEEAEAYQAQGMTPILTLSDPQARVIPVFPSDISAPLERVRAMFTDELADRLGLDLRISEKTEASGTPTATQIVERAKVHSKAIGNIININVPFFQRISEITLNYARDLWGDDDRKVAVNEGSEQEAVLELGQAVRVAEGWKGGFFVDVSIDLILTRSEKVTIMNELKQSMLADMQIPFYTEEEIKPMRDATVATIKLMGLDDVFQDKEIEAFYNSLVKRGQAQVQMQQEQEQAAQRAQQQQVSTQQGATKDTPEIQKAAANAGAEAPQPSQKLIG